jgi:hypothetical protein
VDRQWRSANANIGTSSIRTVAASSRLSLPVLNIRTTRVADGALTRIQQPSKRTSHILVESSKGAAMPVTGIGPGQGRMSGPQTTGRDYRNLNDKDALCASRVLTALAARPLEFQS